MDHPATRYSKVFTASPAIRPKWDGIVTVGAFLGWYAGFQSRASFIQLSCAQNPSSCSLDALNPIDRWGLIYNYHPLADQLSFWTQDGAGVFAVLCMIFFSVNRRTLWTQILLLCQASFLNGTLNEIIRLIVQRPRPFVYLNPTGQGGSADHYTSFYSGHTSFAALACTLAILSAWDASRSTKRIVWVTAAILTISTGAFRVIAGRHFITDVTFGALAGAAIALAVNSLHRGGHHANTTT